MITLKNPFATVLTLLAAAVCANAAAIGEVRVVPALPAALGAVAAAPALLSAPTLSAPALSAPLPAASLPIKPLPLPSGASLPAAPTPIDGPIRLPGVHNPIPVPQPLEVSDASYLDWSFLDGPDAAAATVRADRGPKNLPPGGAAAQLKFATAAANKPAVTIGADPVFDAARPKLRVLVTAE
ncbi:MAG: hypothetical protein HY079_08775 [Elusimicrobia bacterium]|nr:hypothetical protein [Elusimicrobiota bacterium]